MPADSPDWQAATDVAPILLGTVQIANGASANTVAFTLPSTTTGLRIVGLQVSPFLTELDVIGTTTEVAYLGDNNIGGIFNAVYNVPVAAAIDPVVNITVKIGAPNPGPGALTVAWVAALTATGMEAVYADPRTPLNVKVTNTPAVTVPTFPKVIPATSATLAMQVANITASVVSGTPNVLKAGVAGQTITVYGYEFDISPTTGANIGRYDAILDDTSAATIVGRAELLWQTAAGAGSLRWSRQLPYGIALPVGAGLQVAVPAGSTGPVTVVGCVDYTQG